MNKQSYDRGLKLFRKMAGCEADAIRRRWRRLAPDFERFVIGFLAGEVWPRPGLDLRTRSLVTIAALAAVGRPQALALNVRMALNNGASREEIVETLLHLAPYISFPATWEALLVAGQIVDEQARRTPRGRHRAGARRGSRRRPSAKR